MPAEVSPEAVSEESPAVSLAANDNRLSPGRMLRAARQKRNFTQREIADSLHISVSFVNAIEQDEHSKLPGAVFTKGYIKRYSEIMALDETAVLAAYDNLAPAVIASGAGIPRKSQRIKMLQWSGYGPTAVFISLFLGLWIWKDQQSDALDDSEGPVRIQSVVSAGIEQPLDPILVAPPDNSSASSAAAEEMRDAQTLRSEDPQLTQVGEQAVAAASERTERDEESALGMEVPKTKVYVVGEGNDTLAMRFSGTSWVEVKDSSGGREYRDLRLAGDALEIKGLAPFDVFLGDAPRTQLIFNGSEIDFSREIRIDNSVQLTVGF